MRLFDPDVLLVNPIKGAPGDEYSSRKYAETVGPLYLFGHFHYNWPAEPVYFNLLSGALRSNNITVEVVDGFCHRFNSDEMLDVLKLFKPRVIAFAVFYNTLRDTLECIKTLKTHFPDVPVVLGSAFASPHWRRLLEQPGVDFVVVGDGEIAFAELVGKLLAGIDPKGTPGVASMVNGEPKLTTPSPIVELDTLPFASRDLISIVRRDKHGVSMYTSRGCSFANCSFCYLLPYQAVALQPKWRSRSPENVVAEIEYLIKEHSIERITFVDEDYFGDNQHGLLRAVRIAELILEKHLVVHYYVNSMARSILAAKRGNYLPLLAASGLESVFIGFETASPTALAIYRKPQRPDQYDEIIEALSLLGININPGLITFSPTSSLEDVRGAIDLAHKVRYYDIFLFGRRLVDLAAAADAALTFDYRLESDLTRHDEIPWLTQLRQEHSCVLDDFVHREVAFTCQAMRLVSHYLYDIVSGLCINAPDRVQEVRNLLIEAHFDAFYEALDLFQEPSSESMTFDDLSTWALGKATDIGALARGPIVKSIETSAYKGLVFS